MKKISLLLLCATLTATPINAEESHYRTIKNSCMVMSKSMPETKAELLLQAKREATSELFGELITSFSSVQDFELSADSVTSSSAGFVRIKGDAVYSNGANLGEVCVQIHAYVTEDDRNKFKPVHITNKQCASDATLTVSAIKKHTEEQVIISTLINYDRKLETHNKKQMLPLVHKVKYLESGFIPDTATYCAKFEGVIYPVEILALENSAPTRQAVVLKKATPTSSKRPVPDSKKRIYPKDQSGFLAKILGGSTGGARLNSISTLAQALNSPLSIKEITILLKGIDNYRSNAVEIIKRKLPAGLTFEEMKILLADSSGGNRLKIITLIAPKLPDTLKDNESTL
ncbi:MAG: hypothetical protein Q9M31_08855, partial [Mariprofundus sp.]|nr:hypothetical protein [Mariprofundus sp.]